MNYRDQLIIAKSLSNTKPLLQEREAFSQWSKSCLSLAGVLETDTPGFNRRQFLTECGVPARRMN